MPKFNSVREHIYEYIWNRLQVCADIDEIAIEINHKYPQWIVFPNCPPDMQHELTLALIAQQRFLNQYKVTALANKKDSIVSDIANAS